MPQTFTHRRIVEFHETDMAGIVHFSRFFTWAEAAEHALLRSLGLSVVTRLDDGSELGWPRVRVEIDFAAPARFQETIEVQLHIRQLKSKAIVYGFKIVRPTDDSNVEMPLAAGAVTVVCTRTGPDGVMKATAIPKRIADLLRPYVG